MNDNFSTKDLYLAAMLYAKGLSFQQMNRQGRICWFVFSDKNQCELFQQQFFSKMVEVNAKEFVDAIRTLKDLVFSE